jgi:thiol-disulfide isomerase/thioredoxin
MNNHLKQLLNGVLILFWMIIYWILIGLIPKYFPDINSAYHSELFHVTIAISILVFLVLVYVYYYRNKERRTITFLMVLGLPYFLLVMIAIIFASNWPRTADLFFMVLGIGIMAAMDTKHSSNKQKIVAFIISFLLIIPLYYVTYDNISHYASKNKLQKNRSLDNFNFKIMDRQGLSFNLGQLKGKTVCVDMWASSCGNCISAMPDFEKLNVSFRNDTNYKIMSLFCPVKKDQTFEWFQDYINRKFHYDIDYYYIDFETFNKLKIRQFPEFLLISKESKLIYRGQISYLPYVNDNIYVKLKSINENY